MNWLSQLLTFPSPQLAAKSMCSPQSTYLLYVLRKSGLPSCHNSINWSRRRIFLFTANKQTNTRHERSLTRMQNSWQLPQVCTVFHNDGGCNAPGIPFLLPQPQPNTHLSPAPSCNSLLHLQPSSAKLLCLLRRHLQLPLAYLITRVWRSLNLKPLQPLESTVLHLHYSWRARAQPIPRLATFYGGELQFLIILCGTFEWQLCCHLIYRRLFIRASQGKELITFLTFLEHIAKVIGLS